MTRQCLAGPTRAVQLDCTLESSYSGPEVTVVTIAIVVEDEESAPPEKLARLKAEIQAEADEKVKYLRRALKNARESSLLLEGKVQALEVTVETSLKYLSLKPTFYLERGDANVGDEYNVGQAGAVGPKAHAENMSFQQIGGNIERSMDLAALAGELATLRRAMKGEATEPEHDAAVGKVAEAEQAAKEKDSSKVAEALKGAGKWALDAATKVGTTLASEALKESMGMK